MEDNSEETTVRVAVRCRPFNSREKANGETSCVRITSDQIVLVNPSGHSEEHSFAFDTVIDESFSQESVWSTVGMPILNKAFSGFNATIFAYGQTGSGKTWSMQGGEGELQGIIPRMNYSLFERISLETSQRPTVQFLITVSYFEIYNEVIFDLLDSSDRRKRAAANKGGLEIKEHPALGVYVKGLQEIVVDSAPKLQNIIDQGMKSRTVASTQMNADSSRSHSVFLINVHQKDVEDESKNIFAKVNLVDLAGSERVKSTGATGSILKESANINKSLSALGNVINALVEASKGKGAFIPYRNSKLTRVLQESLGGNSITAMLAALSPAACNFEETLSTLKYANRAKSIKVKAVKNEQSNAISRLNDEIKALKDKLATQGGGQSEQGESALEDKNRQRLLDLEEAMKSTWEAKSKMSQEYERDRQQLLIEQQNAARQLDAARQRNWAALQQKGDLDSTLSHVRTLVADRTGGPVAALLSRWTEALREVGVLEKALSEQDTVVQVYRSTLARDSEALVQVRRGCRAAVCCVLCAECSVTPCQITIFRFNSIIIYPLHPLSKARLTPMTQRTPPLGWTARP
ncbi:P-loop containing nucleoside triphosphate hydrolase protein [Ochromonadaceae sp. CCMP2298]|nr:P-loop containing nucleoside triphosphate hydrolase protein [Ochromonadaceae sp. CCMP2298]